MDPKSKKFISASDHSIKTLKLSLYIFFVNLDYFRDFDAKVKMGHFVLLYYKYIKWGIAEISYKINWKIKYYNFIKMKKIKVGKRRILLKETFRETFNLIRIYFKATFRAEIVTWEKERERERERE